MTKAYVGGKSVVKNAARNFLGQGIPLVAAFYCIPQLISVLGTERFGFLTLMWVAVGYLSIFDLGLGQALTKLVADKIGRGENDNISPLFWTAIWLMCGLGLAGMAIVEMAVPFLVNSVLNLPDAFKQETYAALRVIALSLPLVIVSAGTRGVLEAYQRFDLINWIRIPLGIFTFSSPLIVARYLSNELSAIALVLVLGRFVFLMSTMWLCFKIIPALRQVQNIQGILLKPLFGFGGWMTLANLISPMMVYLDRFVIGTLISMSAVAYYVTPYEVITKLWILPGALVGVLFSAFTINLAHHAERTFKMFNNAAVGIFLMMLPLTMLATVFAREGLTFWLGNDFARHAVSVFQILAIGVFINSFGRVPFVFIQAAGRPDIPACLYLFELPLYLFGLWYMMSRWGIEGAAIAWVARIVLDNVVLMIACEKLVPDLKKSVRRTIVMSVMPCVVFPSLIYVEGMIAKLMVAVVTLLLCAVAVYWFRDVWQGRQSLLTITR